MLFTKIVWGRTATVVKQALAIGNALTGDGVIVVVDHIPLARILEADGRRVVSVGARSSSTRQLRRSAIVCPYSLPLRDGASSALVGNVADGTTDAFLAEWTRVIRDGGAIVLVGRTAPEEAARLALCAGLIALEQRACGRATFVTSGLVCRSSRELQGVKTETY
ncbi:MAG: hypothetical protein V2A73_16515 [Pseudomonadota bacterium]